MNIPKSPLYEYLAPDLSSLVSSSFRRASSFETPERSMSMSLIDANLSVYSAFCGSGYALAELLCGRQSRSMLANSPFITQRAHFARYVQLAIPRRTVRMFFCTAFSRVFMQRSRSPATYWHSASLKSSAAYSYELEDSLSAAAFSRSARAAAKSPLYMSALPYSRTLPSLGSISRSSFNSSR